MTEQPRDPSPSETPPARRRSRAPWVLSALVAAALAGGALFGVNRLASAQQPEPPALDRTATTAENTPGPRPRDFGERGRFGFGRLGGFGGFEDSEITQCMAAELGIELGDGSAPPDLEALGDLGPEQMSTAWETCSALLPEGLREKVGTMSECLGDLGRAAAEHSGVAVLTPEDLSMLRFGEGDGSITVTKTGDTYTVTQTGDVAELDVRASLAECGITIPSGFGGFGRGLNLGD